MPHIQGQDRHTELQFPPTLDEYVSPDNPVRFIDAFVDQLDLAALGFARVTAAVEGRPGYAPGDLLKLYLYWLLQPHSLEPCPRARDASQCGTDVAAQTTTS